METREGAEARESWGSVFVAAAFALAVIGGAAFFVHYQNTPQAGSAAANEGDGLSALGRYAASTTPVVSPTLTEDLSAGYQSLLNQKQFTSADLNKVVQGVAQKDVKPLAVVPNITLAELNVKDGAAVDTYLKLLSVVVGQSSRVKEYEVDVFSRAVAKGATTTPTLEDDASLYRRIAAALLVMEVPKSLAPQHLELVKSVGALGNAVAGMASWSGDPVEALVAMDAFNKAEAYVEGSIDSLLSAAAPLAREKST